MTNYLLEEIKDFLPKQIYDIHAHVWRLRDLNIIGESPWKHFTSNGEEASIQSWHDSLSNLLGVSVAGGLFFPVPMRSCNIDHANQYIVDQLNHYGESLHRGLMLVTPSYSDEQVDFFLQHNKILGFKPYHTFSDKSPTTDALITDMIPERYWAKADQHGLIIMLHQVRDQGMMDPDNQRQLLELCGRYPNAKCILAHNARSFHAPHAKAVKVLRGLENIYFDMSGICESEAIWPLIYEFGPRKFMWASDYPISDNRARAVTVGDGFFWMQDDTVDWSKMSTRAQPSYVGLESIRALKTASEWLGLNRADIEDIFYNNAMRLTGQLQAIENITQQRYREAKQIIPGGTQLLSKRPELAAPEQWPAYFREARGCEVWDLDGKHYYDMSTNGIGSCLLGYRQDEVTSAVQRRLLLGSMSTLNPPEEVDLGERLISLHPWAEQVRFARSGGEVATIAVRIARATTSRSIIAICGYHGWHDWYLAANLGANDSLQGHLLPGLEPSGVPKELRGTTVTFRNNDLAEFDAVINQYGDRLAAIIMEPCRYGDPVPGFLQHIRQRSKDIGAMLIFDEITIGWRLHYGGAHLRFGVNPDLAIFAKALGNGHAISAVLGTKAAMDGAHHSFISSTYWTESIGPVAALATLDVMDKQEVPARVARVGERVEAAWKKYAEQYSLPVKVGGGYPCLAKFEFKHEHANTLKTLYTIKMLKKGYLAGSSIYPTLAHTDDIISAYSDAIAEVFQELSTILKNEDMAALQSVIPAQAGFRRLN